MIGELSGLGEDSTELEKALPRVPFRILLRHYAQWVSSQCDSDSSDSIFDYLSEQIKQKAGKNITPDDIHKIVRTNPTLLILDGLDEVPEKNLRAKVLNNIHVFTSQLREVLDCNLRVIATTRPYGYSEEFDPTRYLHITLQKLSSEKTMLYARQWTATREPVPQKVSRIIQTIELCLEDKLVCVLTQTPLQVTILLVIIRVGGTPPNQREELFNHYMDIIYKREANKGPELLHTDKDLIYGIHKYIAYLLHMRAGKERTGALMEILDFEKHVEEYLKYSKPLLNKWDVKSKSCQIIDEARQRLVLIESPEDGKIGFGLATTREFFAAAHLFDTATKTDERDVRFKAIARSPHWRNVALFFAGRAGRKLPGEAPRLINVCGAIDFEGVDIFLKRGAELVTELVDDRVFREEHNEISAIQYSLRLLERDFLTDHTKFASIYKSLSEQQKEKIIRPWLENQLKSIIPEKLQIYIDTYQ